MRWTLTLVILVVIALICVGSQQDQKDDPNAIDRQTLKLFKNLNNLQDLVISVSRNAISTCGDFRMNLSPQRMRRNSTGTLCSMDGTRERERLLWSV